MIRKLLSSLVLTVYLTFSLVPASVAQQAIILTDEQLDTVHAEGLFFDFDVSFGSVNDVVRNSDGISTKQNSGVPKRVSQSPNAKIQILSFGAPQFTDSTTTVNNKVALPLVDNQALSNNSSSSSDQSSPSNSNSNTDNFSALSGILGSDQSTQVATTAIGLDNSTQGTTSNASTSSTNSAPIDQSNTQTTPPPTTKAITPNPINTNTNPPVDNSLTASTTSHSQTVPPSDGGASSNNSNNPPPDLSNAVELLPVDSANSNAGNIVSNIANADNPVTQAASTVNASNSSSSSSNQSSQSSQNAVNPTDTTNLAQSQSASSSASSPQTSAVVDTLFDFTNGTVGVGGPSSNIVNVGAQSQQYLSALVNVNSAGSIVNVLLNITININSTVENLVNTNNVDIKNFNSFSFQ